MPLTAKQQRFADEYLIDLNATQAAIRAGYSARGADVQGVRLLGNASVAAAVAEGQRARAERTGITADAVLARWWTIATADPNELIEFRRPCCRYCYGDGHAYQFTAAEWNARVLGAKGVALPPAGGIGYDARKPPTPDCPECFGEGVERPFPKDTRHLSDAARMLYAGVKVTKDGLEMRLHDQGAALANVAKHLGMFTEKVEHSGAVGVVDDVGAAVLDRLRQRRKAAA